MKKLIFIIAIGIMLCLCGCGTADKPIKGNYLGLWEHTEYPNVYSVVVYEQTKDSISFVVRADRKNTSGMVMQMASVRQENIKAGSGDVCFRFRDNFGNSGDCRLQLNPDELTFNFNVTGGYQGNWCIDAGNGSYRKTKELSELDWFDKDEYEVVDFNDEPDNDVWGIGNADQVEGKSHLWYGKYYLAGNDLEHDRTKYYIIASDGSVERGQYGRTTSGNYYMYESDKNEYDFRVLFKLDNGEEFLLYGNSNIPESDSRRDPKDDVTFYQYYQDGRIEFFGRYLNESYIGMESVYRVTNE